MFFLVRISHIDFIKITIYNYLIGRTISMNMNYKKLVIAVLQGDDYPDVVKDLNDHGYYVTLLNSSGGFLKKKSKTIMIGVEDEKLDEVKKILKLMLEKDLLLLLIKQEWVCQWFQLNYQQVELSFL